LKIFFLFFFEKCIKLEIIYVKYDQAIATKRSPISPEMNLYLYIFERKSFQK